MDNLIYINNLHSLKSLRNALNRFKKEAGRSLVYIEKVLQDFLGTIKLRIINERRELEKCERLISLASIALRNCETQNSKDFKIDCRAEIHELNRLIQDKNIIEQRLREIEKTRGIVENKIRAYHKMAICLKEKTFTDITNAIKYLKDIMADIENYLLLQANDSAVLLPSSEASSINNLNTKPEQNPKVPYETD